MILRPREELISRPPPRRPNSSLFPGRSEGKSLWEHPFINTNPISFTKYNTELEVSFFFKYGETTAVTDIVLWAHDAKRAFKITNIDFSKFCLPTGKLKINHNAPFSEGIALSYKIHSRFIPKSQHFNKNGNRIGLPSGLQFAIMNCDHWLGWKNSYVHRETNGAYVVSKLSLKSYFLVQNIV